MTELKRPERYVQFESIKPELKEITEFYTRKTADYQYKIKQLNEYVDALENEISVLKETPKVEVLLDSTDKQLVVVPEFVSEWFDDNKHDLEYKVWEYIKHWDEQEENEFKTFMDFNVNNPIQTIFKMLDGYTVEKEKLYRLKNKITNQYINMNPYNGHCHESIIFGDRYKCVFTQSEIDDMETGSYEQIKVESHERPRS